MMFVLFESCEKKKKPFPLSDGEHHSYLMDELSGELLNLFPSFSKGCEGATSRVMTEFFKNDTVCTGI
jgi:hypothetical protein